MADYKDTLNLPQTAFPMKADLAKREPDLLRYWQELDLYARQRAEFAPHRNLPAIDVAIAELVDEALRAELRRAQGDVEAV